MTIYLQKRIKIHIFLFFLRIYLQCLRKLTAEYNVLNTPTRTVSKMEQTPKKVTVNVKKRKRFASPTVHAIVNEASVMRNQSLNGVPSDVMGSYTGNPVKGDIPEQDADDL